jgi:hypothetical protein
MQVIAEPTWIIVMHHTGTTHPTSPSLLTSAPYREYRAEAKTDCGMTHFPDQVIRESLLKIAPSEKNQIEAMSFGEINGS